MDLQGSPWEQGSYRTLYRDLLWRKRRVQGTLKRVSVALDLDLLKRAQDALGTHGIQDTIDRPPREAVTAGARRRTIDRLESLPPINSDDLRREIWQTSSP